MASRWLTGDRGRETGEEMFYLDGGYPPLAVEGQGERGSLVEDLRLEVWVIGRVEVGVHPRSSASHLGSLNGTFHSS
jgi:hypothetical protein